MRKIPLGAKGSFSLLVQPEHLADRFKDAILPPVFATPVMIMVMENAALNAIKAYLDPGESAVGTAVNVRHLAATPVGRLVTGEAEVRKSTGGKSSSPSEQPRAPRRSWPARIPGSSSTWRNSHGGLNERGLSRFRRQFPTAISSVLAMVWLKSRLRAPGRNRHRRNARPRDRCACLLGCLFGR
jgi:predicted thioesterase